MCHAPVTEGSYIVVELYYLSTETNQANAREALAASPQDSALFLFQKTVDLSATSLSSSNN